MARNLARIGEKTLKLWYPDLPLKEVLNTYSVSEEQFFQAIQETKEDPQIYQDTIDMKKRHALKRYKGILQRKFAGEDVTADLLEAKQEYDELLKS